MNTQVLLKKSQAGLLGHARPWLLLACLATSLSVRSGADENDDHEIAAGPLFQEFKLTLDSGTRTEALGPFFYNEMKETQHTWAIPPILSYTHDPATESYEFDFLYPLMTYDRFGGQYRWQLGQLLNIAGGPTQTESYRDRYTLFPVYFQQRSSDPTQDYLAVGPFFGHMFNHLFRDEIRYVMFPIFSETHRKDVVTDNWFYPIGHVRHGDGLKGWQVLPFAGHEHKEVTYETNIWHEASMVSGHDSRFIMWPLYENDHNGIGSDNPEWVQASLPLYNFLRSPKRDATTVFWPFFTWVDDRDKKYKEWELPYPFVVIARGEGKHTTRFFPLVSWAHSATFESDFFLWPLYKYKALHAPPADQVERRVVFYLYWDKVLKNTETGQSNRRITLWPLFIYSREFNGNKRLQVLAIIEGILPSTKSIPRDYAQVYSLWRSEKNPRANKTSQSLLWNLYRRDSGPDFKKCSLLFGLFQYESDAEGKRVRLLHMIPLGAKRAPAKPQNPSQSSLNR